MHKTSKGYAEHSSAGSTQTLRQTTVLCLAIRLKTAQCRKGIPVGRGGTRPPRAPMWHHQMPVPALHCYDCPYKAWLLLSQLLLLLLLLQQQSTSTSSPVCTCTWLRMERSASCHRSPHMHSREARNQTAAIVILKPNTPTGNPIKFDMPSFTLRLHPRRRQRVHCTYNEDTACVILQLIGPPPH